MDSNKAVTARFCKLLYTVADLQSVKDDLDGHCLLMNDIDASETASWNNGAGFEPIGNYYMPFNGVFDGNGKRIFGISMNYPDYGNIGLFGNTGYNCVIKDLGLEDVNAKGYSYVGGLVGSQHGTIMNCYMSGSVSGKIHLLAVSWGSSLVAQLRIVMQLVA